jgi:hypothetical protein
MKRWEYFTIRKTVEDSELDELGALGWELVAAVSPGHFVVHYIFKRERSAD